MCVYAIYPHDENGQFAGVYVGITSSFNSRIRNHKNCGKDYSLLMRENGYTVQILHIIKHYRDEKHLEGDWIEFFRRETDLKIFNKHFFKNVDATRLNKTIYQDRKKITLSPIYTEKGIVWHVMPEETAVAR